MAENRPQIMLSVKDANRLEALLESLSDDVVTKKGLEEELDRAVIVDDEMLPNEVVTMNSTVQFKISSSKEVFCLKLVFPKDMDEKGKTISILSPVGSALLGLAINDEIEWPAPNSKLIKVKILDVIKEEVATI
ncbi:TPA: nucleoside diphosphate kinase regulator [Photobacterium damselae]|uniref:Nucleoside diphosphate kinase regulator n=1 Tax=Photobacterium damselae TaxID=38293 RepID=A0ABD6X4J1_PHODM|nr:nucleoside diphosphate kinase regulator [Photobacterium damselae]ARR50907.1 nucleoside diphosphate kinase regulator [Photobacterium damselae subsp. damselae]EJN6958754.1 nucleoside diphosphate kinase regulator [Photobacterium damselae]KAB1520165.1 nucleoside diphosphate kinase regulator [Photobacterium damselae subsp. damselae]MCG3845093.1 nucleoside diphosphate kinase regulator [Photobacterium damselae]MCG9778250.1 nucleoside diphosphate kinase regulator [Photobacterium damselae]